MQASADPLRTVHAWTRRPREAEIQGSADPLRTVHAWTRRPREAEIQGSVTADAE